ncbi:hypothetical protein HCN44_008100 [Aphidius gifuensis]|uniref:Gustatory receptor n=1 Tax=Aphidius gifuensis TaxID=684658 RepID=A0A834XME8_APHGI|nr:hypothetical protein HCN44_008100 [Aphidius gifuensis]
MYSRNYDRKNLPKSSGHESTLYKSIHPLVIIFRSFGISPYEFNDRNKLVLSYKNMIYTFLFIIIYTLSIWSVCSKLTGVDRNGKSIFGNIEIVKALSNYIVVMIDIIMTLLTIKKFTKIYNMIQSYDEIINSMGYINNEKKTGILVWLIISFNIVIWLAINQAGMNAFDQSFVDNLIYMIIYVGSSVSVTKFSLIAWVLSTRFAHLNFIANENIIDGIFIERLYDVLMTSGEQLEFIYSWSLILWLGNLTLHIVSDLYFLSDGILEVNISYSLMSCLLAWLSTFIWQIILLNWACHTASHEIAGAIATYEVVLLQFHSSGKA